MRIFKYSRMKVRESAKVRAKCLSTWCRLLFYQTLLGLGIFYACACSGVSAAVSVFDWDRSLLQVSFSWTSSCQGVASALRAKNEKILTQSTSGALFPPPEQVFLEIVHKT